jgi:hypothetical protein
MRTLLPVGRSLFIEKIIIHFHNIFSFLWIALSGKGFAPNSINLRLQNFQSAFQLPLIITINITKISKFNTAVNPFFLFKQTQLHQTVIITVTVFYCRDQFIKLRHLPAALL